VKKSGVGKLVQMVLVRTKVSRYAYVLLKENVPLNFGLSIYNGSNISNLWTEFALG
jgi:hypothetical protein